MADQDEIAASENDLDSIHNLGLQPSSKMASRKAETRLITSVAQCRQVTRYLTFFSPVIGLSGYGVDLSATGPLTVLQVATPAGKVYQFDIKACRLMLDRGGLRDLLESQDIVKVLHSCRRLNEALYHQFDVSLNNVFDTQIAYLLLEKTKGKYFPRRVPLHEINTLYGGSPSQVRKGKEFWKKFPAYWAQRPLTDDMITYATGQVLALLPDPYETMNRLLAENKLMDLFEERVQQELIRYIEPDNFVEHRNTKVREVTMQVLAAMEAKYNSDTDPRVLTEDEKQALTYVREGSGEKSWHHSPFNVELNKTSPLILELRKKAAIAEVEDLEQLFMDNPETFKLGMYRKRRLKFLTHHSDSSIKEKALSLEKKLDVRKQERMVNKFQLGSPLSNEETLYIVINHSEMTAYDTTIVGSVITEFEQTLRSKLDTTSDLEKYFRQMRKFDRHFLMSIPMELLRDDAIKDLYKRLQGEHLSQPSEQAASANSVAIVEGDTDDMAVDNVSEHESD